jgi:hypothetical protein
MLFIYKKHLKIATNGYICGYNSFQINLVKKIAMV